jgi:hypothetical protein
MIYNCKICDYETNNKTNFNKHLDTKLHISNSKNTITCEYCNKSFSSNSYLKKHISNTCKKKININNQESDIDIKSNNSDIEMTYKIELLKKEHEIQLLKLNSELQLELQKKEIELKFKDKELELKDKLLVDKDNEIIEYKNNSKDDHNYQKNILNKTIDIINDRYPNSQPLYIIDNFNAQIMKNNIELVDKNKDDICNIGYILVRKHRKKLLIKELCDVFINEYIKKQTPETQGLWVSDLSRYNYVIKEKKENSDVSEWIVDKGGIKLNGNYVKYVLDKLTRIMIIYRNILWDKLVENPDNEELHNDFKSCIDIYTDINNNITGEKIVKTLASYCVFNK